jgi:hypothetical protein
LTYEGVTTVSFWPLMTIVGTRSVDMFCEGEYGARATAALSEGRCSVA